MASVPADCPSVQGPFQPDPRQTAPEAVTTVPVPVGPIDRPAPDSPPEADTDDRPAESWPRFTLAELADQEACAFRAWGNPVGELFARHMDELAVRIRMTDATTPEEYEARIDVYEDDIRGQWEARGYEAGLEAARGQCRCGVAQYQ